MLPNHQPGWLDASVYRKLILPPCIEMTAHQKAPFAETASRGNVAAELGLRAQRRYGIDRAAWNRRWGHRDIATARAGHK